MDEESDITYDLKELSAAEKIWLWRRRQASTNGRERGAGAGRGGVCGRGGARLSAAEAAAMLSLPIKSYYAAERGDGTPEVLEAIRGRGDRLPRPTRAEECGLARRRAATPVEEICAALGGISKPTFYAREAAGHPEVVAFWRERGFSFWT